MTHASASIAPGVHVITVGNEKGGSGKSTMAMHVIAALMHAGCRVGSIDLDARQATLTRFVENRRDSAARRNLALAMPEHRTVLVSTEPDRAAAERDEGARLAEALASLADVDVIVIDTPGRDSHLNKLGHACADTLITPINDSFVDLDVLASVDPDDYRVRHPSKYAEMVFQQKISRAQNRQTNRTFDWIVIRNRLSQLDSKNRQAMDQAVGELARRIGFRLAPGFTERVIFRELFLEGLTLLDLRDPEAGIRLNMSHIAARQELRALLEATRIVAGSETAA